MDPRLISVQNLYHPEGSSSIYFAKIQESLVSNFLIDLFHHQIIFSSLSERSYGRERTAFGVPMWQSSDLTGLPGCYCDPNNTMSAGCNCLCFNTCHLEML